MSEIKDCPRCHRHAYEYTVDARTWRCLYLECNHVEYIPTLEERLESLEARVDYLESGSL